MVTSISSSTASNWADSVFSKLDTKNQGYIDKTDLQDALSKAAGSGKGGGTVNVDDTFSALDGDGNGTVSDAEQAAYEKKLASSQADGSQQATHQKDPMRELAHALKLLKAYAENSGGSDASAASTASAPATNSVSVSVEA